MRRAAGLGVALAGGLAAPAWALEDVAESCDTTPLVTRMAVTRSWPVEGGVHPADRPILVELRAPGLAPTTPDQPVELVLPKSFELSGGKVFGVTTVRSDYGTTRYLPGPYAEWAPAEWDDDRERSMLVQLQVFEAGPGGTATPGELTVGQDYTFKMLVGSAEAPEGFDVWELHFTAGDPAAATAPVSGAFHTIVADSSCEEVHLECTSAPDCSPACAQVGTLQKVRHDVALSGGDVQLPEDQPWVIEYALSDYGFTFRQVRFPDDPPEDLGARIDTFQSASKDGLTACASLTIALPGGPKVDSEVSCDTAEGIPDLCQDGGGGEDAGAADAGAMDAGSADVGGGADTGAGSADTGGAGTNDTGSGSGGGGPGGADAGGTGGGEDTTAGGSDTNAPSFGDTNLDGSGVFGSPGANISVSDGGCDCDQSGRGGALNGWASALLAIGVWLGLRRPRRA